MGSSLHALSEALLAECGQSLSRNVIIESNDGHLALMAVPGAQLALSLLVVSNRSAILGHLLWSAKNCASTLGKLLAY